MQVDKLKPLLLFVILSGALFFAGHRFARQAEVDFVVDHARSSYFLEIVRRLDEIQFDFTESLGSGGTLLTPVSVPETSLSQTGRENPFKQMSSNLFFDSFESAAGLPQDFVAPPPQGPPVEGTVSPGDYPFGLPPEEVPLDEGFVSDGGILPEGIPPEEAPPEEFPPEEIPPEEFPPEDIPPDEIPPDGVASGGSVLDESVQQASAAATLTRP